MTLRFLKEQPTAACAAAAVEPVTAELTAAYDRIRDLERTLKPYEQACRDLNLVNAELARVRDQFVRLLTEARAEIAAGQERAQAEIAHRAEQHNSTLDTLTEAREERDEARARVERIVRLLTEAREERDKARARVERIVGVINE